MPLRTSSDPSCVSWQRVTGRQPPEFSRRRRRGSTRPCPRSWRGRRRPSRPVDHPGCCRSSGRRRPRCPPRSQSRRRTVSVEGHREQLAVAAHEDEATGDAHADGREDHRSAPIRRARRRLRPNRGHGESLDRRRCPQRGSPTARPFSSVVRRLGPAASMESLLWTVPDESGGPTGRRPLPGPYASTTRQCFETAQVRRSVARESDVSGVAVAFNNRALAPTAGRRLDQRHPRGPQTGSPARDRIRDAVRARG